jgi:chromosome partitioning protein
MPVIAIFNHKGGVGKTTTTLNLAAGLTRAGRDALAIDLDAQASLTSSCGLKGTPSERSISSFFRDSNSLSELEADTAIGLKVIPAHFDLSKIDSLQGGNKEISIKLTRGLQARRELQPARQGKTSGTVLIDCCPALGVLSLNAVLAADRVLIPVAADPLSLEGVERLDIALNALERKLNRRIERRVLLTRFDGRRRLSYEIFDRLQQRFGKRLCNTRIVENVSLAESPGKGLDIFTYAPGSTGARDYRMLTNELLACGFAA